MLKYHIQTIEVGAAGAATMDFTNVPQNYDDLLILVSGRSTRSGIVSDDHSIRFNGSFTGYSNRRLYGYLGSAGSDTPSSDKALAGGMSAADATAGTHGNIKIHIPNYRSSLTKSVSAEGVAENNGGSFQTLTTATWSGTQAITNISLLPWAGNYTQYSSASLYGIKHGTSGDVEAAADGGAITQSGGYTIHTFTSSGTFVANRDMDVEYLVVAGGGGAGADVDGSTNGGGGGGGGGYRSSVTGENSGGGASAEPKLRVTASTSYTVVVGAGGAGVPYTNTNAAIGSPGGASVFGNIVANGGGGGGTSNGPGSSGGSGGGAAGFGQTGGSGIANQGFNGGNGDSSAGAGGGGAGGIGGNPGPTNGDGGDGGPGVTSSITGSAVGRAGGGGGGGYSTDGGATDGGAAGSPSGTNAVANKGGGGGGNDGGPSTTGGAGGNGGSGVVIIRYPTPA